jgi:putative spermidine/putrescine transport system ATP-binding protein
MGYRNQIRSRATKAGNLLSISVGGAGLHGTPIDAAADGDIVAAIRPDDLKVTSGGPLTVKVESAQYHGNEFYCLGRATDGAELYFRSENRIQKGDTVHLMADPSRVLVYAETPS